MQQAAEETIVSRNYLNQALPPEVVTGNAGRLMSYRNYPVFSAPWLKRRTSLFAAIFGVLFVLTAAGLLIATKSVLLSLGMSSLTLIAFMLMAWVGPALATWVRYRGWPERIERIGVVTGLCTGILVSGIIDATVSERIEKTLFEPELRAAGVLPEDWDAKHPESGPLSNVASFLFSAVIYGMLGGGLALHAYFNERRRWLEAQHDRMLRHSLQRQHAAELRLGVLQAQIEPHFLFNTLASLRALVRQDSGRAEAVIDALVDHLRATIPRLRAADGGLDSTLEQQFDICISYLKLMQVRMGPRLSYSVDLPEELRSASFPPLMLLSLVENAIKHGIEPKTDAGSVHLSVVREASLLGSRIRVDVVDTGVGLTAETSNGIGLANIRDQLFTRYQGQATLDIQAVATGGTRASICIPELQR